LTHTLVAEPYSSVQVRMGALQAVFYSVDRMPCVTARPGGTVTSRRGNETRRHDYTRLPAALSDELGGVSTSLWLFASPPLILSTESVVAIEWKGMRTSIATRAGAHSPEILQLTSACPAPLTPKAVWSNYCW